MSRRILLIEDEPGARDALASLLLEDGHAVRTAACGRDGIRCFEEFNPDTVLCDVLLPDISGLQVLRETRALARGRVFFIIVTAGGSPEVEERALRREADRFIDKPVDLRWLRRALSEIDGAPERSPNAPH